MELNHRFQGYISLDLYENISIFIKRLWDSSLGLYRHMCLEKRFFQTCVLSDLIPRIGQTVAHDVIGIGMTYYKLTNGSSPPLVL